ncbi:MAG: glycosyltransferase [Nitriliruptoraceae bacterium]
MKLGVVMLTTGSRPDELARAIASVRAQRGITPSVVVVANTEDPAAADAVAAACGEATVLRPGENIGIPAGRNLGLDALGDVEAVAFLDDDAELVDRDVLAQAAAAFTTDPQLAVVSLRLVDPITGRTERRHVPRLVVGDPSRSSWATTFLGGACVIRRRAFLDAGRLPEDFFYAHEETSLAWRLIDRGWRIRYRGDLTVAHPAHPPTRHPDAHRLSMRNRVLLARMHLPTAIGVTYVTTWLCLSLLRNFAARRELLRGLRDGWRMPVDRAPLHWHIVWRLTRYGRPPVV